MSVDNIVIEFENVSKRYKRGKKLLLKEALLDLFKPSETEDFLALKDVSFSVKKGETLGIIGPNGSGKSTILKLIAGVTSPTSGKVHIKGKVAPLIDLGAGFHPELTGRENISLSASIMGLTRKEILSKFNDIVEFAEMDEFIDTPVKHYSTGMYLRLAFAVAVNMEPEILLVDEILSVGDEDYQTKCIKKMQEFQKRGITTIFVSHHMGAVTSFCSRVIYVEFAKVIRDGNPKDVVRTYKAGLNKSTASSDTHWD
jgi:ABC-type polysaccharide/polyol phosphate transport system ATPase subunit